jgi:hypothetical protein
MSKVKSPKVLQKFFSEATKENPLDYSSIHTQVNFLRGKVLTIIDAILPSEENTKGNQKKAVKDLINNEFNEQLAWIHDLTHPNSTMLTDRQMVGVDIEATLNNCGEKQKDPSHPFSTPAVS